MFNVADVSNDRERNLGERGGAAAFLVSIIAVSLKPTWLC